MSVNNKVKDISRWYGRLIIIAAIVLALLLAAWIYIYYSLTKAGTPLGSAFNPHPGLGKVIYILPIGYIDDPILNDVRDFVASDFNHPVKVLSFQPVPESSRQREFQSKADSIRSWIKRKYGVPKDTFRLIAITSDDIYADGYNFIFGQADIGGLVMLVSVNRLKPASDGGVSVPLTKQQAESLYRERMIKLIRHELGHTFGLPHCDNPDCVMNFHASLDALDKGGTEYCDRCRHQIKAHDEMM